MGEQHRGTLPPSGKGRIEPLPLGVLLRQPGRQDLAVDPDQPPAGNIVGNPAVVAEMPIPALQPSGACRLAAVARDVADVVIARQHEDGPLEFGERSERKSQVRVQIGTVERQVSQHNRERHIESVDAGDGRSPVVDEIIGAGTDMGIGNHGDLHGGSLLLVTSGTRIRRALQRQGRFPSEPTQQAGDKPRAREDTLKANIFQCDTTFRYLPARA